MWLAAVGSAVRRHLPLAAGSLCSRTLHLAPSLEGLLARQMPARGTRIPGMIANLIVVGLQAFFQVMWTFGNDLDRRDRGKTSHPHCQTAAYTIAKFSSCQCILEKPNTGYQSNIT